jgi:hypothetical protein
VVSFMGLSVPRSFQASVTWRRTSDKGIISEISNNRVRTRDLADDRHGACVNPVPLSQAPPPCRCSR